MRAELLDKALEMTNGSPYYQLLGMKIKALGKGRSRIEMPFRKDLTHPYGIAHGGAIASLADSAVAMALLSLIEPADRIITIEFKINFFAMVKRGILTARAKIVHQGSTVAVGEVIVTDQDKKRVALVVATYSIKRGSKD